MDHAPSMDHAPNHAHAQGAVKAPHRRIRGDAKVELSHAEKSLVVNQTLSNASWWAIGWLSLAHIVCLAAPFTFTWTALAVTLFLHWVTGSLGICLGYHRMLTHDGMKTSPWVRNVFAMIGTLAGEGTPLDVNRAKQQLAKSQAERAIILRDLAKERRRMLELIGFASEDADWTADVDASAMNATIIDETAAITLAGSQRLDVAAARSIVEAFRADLSVEEKSRLKDFGLGADSPILLDYRADPADPRVIHLEWADRDESNDWVVMAPDFASFVDMLGL